MTYDIHLQIDQNTLVGQAIEELVESQHVSPDEAVLCLLGEKSPGSMSRPTEQPESLWGAGAADAEILDEIVAQAMAERRNRFAKRLHA